jgi:uncharacterized membrane protein YjjP (DUF1212 family)
MGWVDALGHLINFMLPAAFVALIVTTAGHYLKKNSPFPHVWRVKFAINFIASLAVLVIGLILTGRDGKMFSYLAMALASATVQWIFSGGWRK